jgi:hypothetical protein
LTPFISNVLAMADKGKFVAAYQQESFYELLRADGSQAASTSAAPSSRAWNCCSIRRTNASMKPRTSSADSYR